MLSRLALLSTLVLSTCLAGCGPVRSTTALIQAQQASLEAQEAGADELSPYYWTLARTHHEKAREEQMDAEYKDAFELGQQAKSYYEQARNAALGAQEIETEEVESALEQEILEQRRLRQEEQPVQQEQANNPFEDLEEELESEGGDTP